MEKPRYVSLFYSDFFFFVKFVYFNFTDFHNLTSLLNQNLLFNYQNFWKHKYN